MSKIKEIKFNRFDGGISDDARQNQSNVFQVSKNFNIYKDAHSLEPVNDWVADETYGAGTIKANRIRAIGGTGTTIYGVGRKDDNTGIKLFEKQVTASAWTPMSFGATVFEASGGSPTKGFFFLESNSADIGSGFTGPRYFFVTNTNSTLDGTGFRRLGMLAYTSNPPTLNTSVATLEPLTGSSIHQDTQIIRATGDNNVYFNASGRSISKMVNGSITGGVFVVPEMHSITSFANYGSYLAIAVEGASGQTSKVILWDLASPKATEIIDWGEGRLRILANVGGMLVGVSDKYLSASGGGLGKGSMVVKVWNGGSVQTVKEVYADSTTSNPLLQCKVVKGDNLYWYANVPQTDENLDGIWSFGRKNTSSPYALSLYQTVPGAVENFTAIGDYFYLVHSNDGSISRTSTNAYPTAILETQTYGGDTAMLKVMRDNVAISFKPLTSGQSITAKYRKDGATSWTTFATTNTVGAMSLVKPVEGDFREIEFRIEGVGGAVLRSLYATYEELSYGDE